MRPCGCHLGSLYPLGFLLQPIAVKGQKSLHQSSSGDGTYLFTQTENKHTHNTQQTTQNMTTVITPTHPRIKHTPLCFNSYSSEEHLDSASAITFSVPFLCWICRLKSCRRRDQRMSRWLELHMFATLYCFRQTKNGKEFSEGFHYGFGSESAQRDGLGVPRRSAHRGQHILMS